uniref:R13L1/DRL21-like LRR repeat region domain-containing protein n=1 Tax=Oryza meridionalis TaxID=40149 RepID=A0A0E0CL20_9ORYZ
MPGSGSGRVRGGRSRAAVAGERAERQRRASEQSGSGRERAADELCSERAGGGAERRRQASERPSDRELVRSLHRLARDLSAVDTPAPFLRASFASISRRSKLLAAALDDLRGAAGELPQISRLCGAAGELPRLASLCLREVLLVQGDRRRLLGAKPDAAAAGVRRDGGGATGAQPRPGHAARPLAGRRAGRLGLADDVLDVLALASRQCRWCSPAPEAEQALKASVLSLIQEIEPRHRRRTSGAQSLSSLDLMRDPVVVANGQTYDRDSSGRWSGAERRRHPATPRGKMREEGREEGKERFTDADVVGCRLLRSSSSYGALPLPFPSASTPVTSLPDPAAPVVKGNVKLKEKRHLGSLSLEWSEDDGTNSREDCSTILGNLEPNSNMKNLKISGYAGAKIPYWIAKAYVKNLISLDLGIGKLYKLEETSISCRIPTAEASSIGQPSASFRIPTAQASSRDGGLDARQQPHIRATAAGSGGLNARRPRCDGGAAQKAGTDDLIRANGREETLFLLARSYPC